MEKILRNKSNLINSSKKNGKKFKSFCLTSVWDSKIRDR